MASSNQGGNRGGKEGNAGGNKQSARGFASMDPQRQREIASEGGRAAHEKGTAHEFTSEEARRAGSMSHKNDGNRQSGARGSANKAEQTNQVNPASNPGSQQGGDNS
ncbi:KGG domain-containing protein [Pseudoduganella sp. RAF53_2]|uniref:KGG domain-containing protein n=1 Tax=unclassified Pseudoduganella TaxID=2637179 RepID=UPI003F9BE2B3